MNRNQKLFVPSPIIDAKEKESIKVLCDRYEKMTQPTMLAKAGKKAIKVIPKPVKKAGKNIKDAVKEKEIYLQCIKIISKGFVILEKQAAKSTISEKAILKKLNQIAKENKISNLDEICLLRSYDISKVVSKFKTQGIGLAFVEGGVAGFFGFSALLFNLVSSMFLYFRAVQSIAMFYGYDIKNNASELVIASEVFMKAMSPDSSGSDEISGLIEKIMVMAELTATKQLSKKTWEEMAKHGGIALLLCQVRALANKTAKQALQKAGEKGLEKSLFKTAFEQVGKKLTKESIGKSVPVVGAVVSALLDTTQMNTVLEFADVFYNKRYLYEKEVRINTLFGDTEEFNEIIIDIPNNNNN